MNAFYLEHLSLSDYASTDQTGRFIIAGMFGETTVFPKLPPFWPPYYIALVVKPFKKNFKVVLKLVNKENNTLWVYSVSYCNEGEIDDRERLAFLNQMPPLPFDGAGVYKLVLEEDGEIYFEKSYNFEEGVPSPIIFGSVEAHLEIISPMPDFRAALAALSPPTTEGVA